MQFGAEGDNSAASQDSGQVLAEISTIEIRLNMLLGRQHPETQVRYAISTERGHHPPNGFVIPAGRKKLPRPEALKCALRDIARTAGIDAQMVGEIIANATEVFIPLSTARAISDYLQTHAGKLAAAEIMRFSAPSADMHRS